MSWSDSRLEDDVQLYTMHRIKEDGNGNTISRWQRKPQEKSERNQQKERASDGSMLLQPGRDIRLSALFKKFNGNGL